jgi:hypothetical protein
MQQDKQELIKSLVSYNKDTGDMKYNGRLLIADYQGFVVLYIDKKLVKLKIEKLACLVGLGRLPDSNERVFNKNLVVGDLRLNNIGIVDKEVFMQIKEAKINLDGSLCLVPHDTDQFCYWLCYREGARQKRELIHDIVSAKKAFNRRKLKYIKLVSKFCVFD